MELLMNRVLPQADYCSFAAPLIEEEVKTQITNEIKKSFVVLNGFNEFDFEFKELFSHKSFSNLYSLISRSFNSNKSWSCALSAWRSNFSFFDLLAPI